jgi:hypothetical protein
MLHHVILRIEKKKQKKARKSDAANPLTEAEEANTAPQASTEFMIKPEKITPKLDTSR